jgi:hypothetical protein
MRCTIRDMLPAAQTNPLETSAEAEIDREIAELGMWLMAQGIDPGDPRDRAHEGSRDRLYWRYGYFMGLKQALSMLSSRGAVVH